MKYKHHQISFYRYFIYLEINKETICFTRWDRDYGKGVQWECWADKPIDFKSEDIEKAWNKAEAKRLKK